MSFTCHCGNMGVVRTPNKSQHTKLTLEKKMIPPFPLISSAVLSTWFALYHTQLKNMIRVYVIMTTLDELVLSGFKTNKSTFNCNLKQNEVSYLVSLVL